MGLTLFRPFELLVNGSRQLEDASLPKALFVDDDIRRMYSGTDPLTFYHYATSCQAKVRLCYTQKLC